MTLDGRWLAGVEVLTAVVDAKSFVGAARTLGLTQSGVSRAVARLEAALGVRLFDRNARAVVLTDEGRRFHERVRPLVAGLEEAAQAATGAGAAVRGRLRVNIDPYFGHVVLAPRLGRFLDAHPEVTLDLVVRDRVGDLVGEGFDAAIRFGEPTSPAVIRRRLLQSRIVTVASPGYLARFGRPRRPADLAHHRCILFRDAATGRPFEWELRRGDERVDVPAAGRLLVNDPSVLLQACAAGEGIAQVFELGLGPWLRAGTLVNLFPRWSDERFPLYAFHPSRHLPPARLRAFLDFVAAFSVEDAA